MKKLIILIFSFSLISACAGPNPNPGERTVDNAWLSGNYDSAFNIVTEKAKSGYPWAQLRLGIFYENGMGTSKNIKKAEYWYKKTISQKSTGNWANGLLVGATGKTGYFNQNSDALIAEHNLAQLYSRNNGDLNKALEHINNVIKETNGKTLFFCCEFAGGRYFTQEQIVKLKKSIQEKMNK